MRPNDAYHAPKAKQKHMAGDFFEQWTHFSLTICAFKATQIVVVQKFLRICGGMLRKVKGSTG
jgi:hypothetical protein